MSLVQEWDKIILYWISLYRRENVLSNNSVFIYSFFFNVLGYRLLSLTELFVILLSIELVYKLLI